LDQIWNQYFFGVRCTQQKSLMPLKMIQIRHDNIFFLDQN
jgi:hypothetical protein